MGIGGLSDFIRGKEQRGEAVEKDTTDVLYNRACYFCLKSTKVHPEQRDRYKELAYSDLERSIQISPENKIDAAVDKDFESIRNESRFENLIAVSNKVT